MEGCLQRRVCTRYIPAQAGMACGSMSYIPAHVVLRHPFKNSYHRSVFIHCSQIYNYTANYGRPLILLKTHVVLVRVACGSNIPAHVALN